MFSSRWSDLVLLAEVGRKYADECIVCDSPIATGAQEKWREFTPSRTVRGILGRN